MGGWVETDRLILELMWNYEGPRIVNTNLRKNNSVGGLTLLDINAQYI